MMFTCCSPLQTNQQGLPPPPIYRIFQFFAQSGSSYRTSHEKEHPLGIEPNCLHLSVTEQTIDRKISFTRMYKSPSLVRMLYIQFQNDYADLMTGSDRVIQGLTGLLVARHHMLSYSLYRRKLKIKM